MAKKAKIKDTDYLFLSSYIHAKEPKLVNGERLDAMLEAKNPEDALKVLEELGWPTAGGYDSVSLDKALYKRRIDIFNEMSSLAPDPRIVDVFRIKYDYHNAKVLIKAQAAGISGDELLDGTGRITPKRLSEAVLEGTFNNLPEKLANAIKDAADTLSRTGDPQLSDFIMDKAYFDEYLSVSEDLGSEFLKGYVKLSIDVVNFRSAVRAWRMKKDEAFLKQALVPGGKLSIASILSSYESADVLVKLLSGTPLEKAAPAAAVALAGGKLTAFEKLCDEVLLEYLSKAKLEGFNEKPLIRYLCAVEAEINSIRIVMTGHFNGLPSDKIKERLREGM